MSVDFEGFVNVCRVREKRTKPLVTKGVLGPYVVTGVDGVL